MADIMQPLADKLYEPDSIWGTCLNGISDSLYIYGRNRAQTWETRLHAASPNRTFSVFRKLSLPWLRFAERFGACKPMSKIACLQLTECTSKIPKDHTLRHRFGLQNRWLQKFTRLKGLKFQPWAKDRIRKERALGTYLLASGDVLVILAGILSVAYLSWKKKAK